MEMSRNEAMKVMKKSLRERSGKAWSVTGGRGTAYGWMHISAPPSRLVDGEMTPEDAAELGELLGLGRKAHQQYESVPAGFDFRQEYLDRCAGKTPSVYGTRDWD